MKKIIDKLIIVVIGFLVIHMFVDDGMFNYGYSIDNLASKYLFVIIAFEILNFIKNFVINKKNLIKANIQMKNSDFVLYNSYQKFSDSFDKKYMVEIYKVKHRFGDGRPNGKESWVVFEYVLDIFKSKGSGIKNTTKVKYVSKDYVMKM